MRNVFKSNFRLNTPMRLARMNRVRSAGELAGAVDQARRRRQLRAEAEEEPQEHGQMSHDDLVALSAARAARRSYAQDLQTLIAQDDEQVAAKQLEYARHSVQLKAVEKLHARHQRQARDEQLAAEQTAMDEVSSQVGPRGEGGQR